MVNANFVDSIINRFHGKDLTFEVSPFEGSPRLFVWILFLGYMEIPYPISPTEFDGMLNGKKDCETDAWITGPFARTSHSFPMLYRK